MLNISKLQDLTKDAIKLIEEVEAGRVKLEKDLETYNTQIKNDLMTVKRKDEIMAEDTQAFQTKIQEKTKSLLSKLEQEENYELKQAEKKKPSVTADDVAELQLLAQVDTTGEELSKYAQKYKDNDLALRTISTIAKDKGIYVFDLPEPREKGIRDRYTNVRSRVEGYAKYQVSLNGLQSAQDKMLASMQIDSLKESLI